MAEVIIRISAAAEGGHHYSFYADEKALANGNDYDGGACTSGKFSNALQMASDHLAEMAEHSEKHAHTLDLSDVEPEFSEDPNECGCERCASGEVRHCPDCNDDPEQKKDCQTCNGEGAISRSTGDEDEDESEDEE